MKREPTVIAEELCHNYYHPTQVKVIRNVSLKAYPGQSIAIMGASGEGKSTLLQIMGTLLKPERGTVFICNQRISWRNNAAMRNQQIGFIFQSFYLLDDFSVIDNVLMPARIARKGISPRSCSYQNVTRLLEEFHLLDKIDQLAGTLSGGEKQRVAIVRALCNDPSVLIADEPTGNLDHSTSRQVFQLLLQQASERNKTVIIATHDGELARQCSALHRLQDGVLQ